MREQLNPLCGPEHLMMGWQRSRGCEVVSVDSLQAHVMETQMLDTDPTVRRCRQGQNLRNCDILIL